MADPQLPVNNAKIAYKGQPVNILGIEERKSLPKAKEITVISEFADYEPPSVDMTDLKDVNKEINNLRIRIHRIRKELDKANRISLLAKYQYEQEKKRILIGLSGGSDKQREAIAELMCEELLGKSLVSQAVAQELANHSRDTRYELDALKELSNNLRKQIDLM
jgi:hypothetical protein